MNQLVVNKEYINIKNKFVFTKIVFLLFMIIFVTGCKNTDNPQLQVNDNNKKRIIDNSDLLIDEEINELESKADELSQKYNCDILIITVKSLEGKNPNEYANDYFTTNGYGLGEYKSGISLLVCLDSRDWAVTAHSIESDVGAQEIFSTKRTDKIGEDIIGDLSYGRYYDAFDTFINKVEKYLIPKDNEEKWYSPFIISVFEDVFYGNYKCNEYMTYEVDLTIEINNNICSVTSRYYEDSVTEYGYFIIRDGKVAILFEDIDWIGYFKDNNTIIVTSDIEDDSFELVFKKQ